MKLQRWFNKVWADVFGYFWLPCPVCGEMFGGHEIGEHGILPTKYDRGLAVCKKCSPVSEIHLCSNCGHIVPLCNCDGTNWGVAPQKLEPVVLNVKTKPNGSEYFDFPFDIDDPPKVTHGDTL